MTVYFKSTFQVHGHLVSSKFLRYQKKKKKKDEFYSSESLLSSEDRKTKQTGSDIIILC